MIQTLVRILTSVPLVLTLVQNRSKHNVLIMTVHTNAVVIPEPLWTIITIVLMLTSAPRAVTIVLITQNATISYSETAELLTDVLVMRVTLEMVTKTEPLRAVLLELDV